MVDPAPAGVVEGRAERLPEGWQWKDEPLPDGVRSLVLECVSDQERGEVLTRWAG